MQTLSPQENFQDAGRETSPDCFLLVVSCHCGYEWLDTATEWENTETTPFPKSHLSSKHTALLPQWHTLFFQISVISRCYSAPLTGFRALLVPQLLLSICSSATCGTMAVQEGKINPSPKSKTPERPIWQTSRCNPKDLSLEIQLKLQFHWNWRMQQLISLEQEIQSVSFCSSINLCWNLIWPGQ